MLANYQCIVQFLNSISNIKYTRIHFKGIRFGDLPYEAYRETRNKTYKTGNDNLFIKYYELMAQFRNLVAVEKYYFSRLITDQEKEIIKIKSLFASHERLLSCKNAILILRQQKELPEELILLVLTNLYFEYENNYSNYAAADLIMPLQMCRQCHYIHAEDNAHFKYKITQNLKYYIYEYKIDGCVLTIQNAKKQTYICLLQNNKLTNGRWLRGGIIYHHAAAVMGDNFEYYYYSYANKKVHWIGLQLPDLTLAFTLQFNMQLLFSGNIHRTELVRRPNRISRRLLDLFPEIIKNKDVNYGKIITFILDGTEYQINHNRLINLNTRSLIVNFEKL